MKINLGCGKKPKKGFINVDFNSDLADLNINLEKEGLKHFKTNTITNIYSSHFLEHLKPETYLTFLEDMYRISKNGCIWDLVLPFPNFNNLYSNPLHYRAFAWGYFDSLKPNSRNNYTNIILIDHTPRPNKLLKILYYTFPFLKREIIFKIEVIK